MELRSAVMRIVVRGCFCVVWSLVSVVAFGQQNQSDHERALKAQLRGCDEARDACLRACASRAACTGCDDQWKKCRANVAPNISAPTGTPGTRRNTKPGRSGNRPGRRGPSYEQCRAAYDFRDRELVAAYDKAAAKYNIFREAKADIIKLREELANAREIKAYNAVLIGIKAVANLIEDSIAAVTPQGAVLSRGKKGATKAQRKAIGRQEIARKMKELLDKGREVWEKGEGFVDLAEEEFDEYTKDLIFEQIENLPKIGGIATILINAKENYDTYQEFEESKAIVAEQLEKLQRQIDAYDAAFALAVGDLDAINAMREAIDAACSSVQPPPPPPVPVVRP